MFENIKVGDQIAVVIRVRDVRLATVVHVTRKQVHVQAKNGIDKYSREDGHPLGKENRHFFITETNDSQWMVRSGT